MNVVNPGMVREMLAKTDIPTVLCPRCGGDGLFPRKPGEGCYMCYGDGVFVLSSALRRIKYNREHYPMAGHYLKELLPLVTFVLETQNGPVLDEYAETFEWCKAMSSPPKKMTTTEKVVDCARRIAADATAYIRQQRSVEVEAALIVELRQLIQQLDVEQEST